jgi:hypothetical protein
VSGTIGRTLIKIAVALAVLAVLGVLFVRSARSVRSEPFEVPRGRLTGWTLQLEPAGSDSGTLLSLEPQRELAGALFNQVFTRTGESMSGPVSGAMPLILKAELDERALRTLGPDALLALAKQAGLETAAFEPRCMAHRRISAPGITRQLYYVPFDLPAFDAFRRQVAQRLRDDGVASAFDPGAQSPALIVAATDAAFSRWLPLKADAQECFAPVSVR